MYITKRGGNMDKLKIYSTCPKSGLHDLGISITGTDKYCWSCGALLTEYTCRCSDARCAHPALSHAKFCTKCGKEVVKMTLDGTIITIKEA